MAKRQTIIPQYGTVMKKGVLYYRTRIKDANGKLIALYAKTPEELYKRETIALEQIENATFHRKTPTVAEYCEKWLLMQSVHVRATTLTDYTSKVRRHIIAELGDKRMGEVNRVFWTPFSVKNRIISNQNRAVLEVLLSCGLCIV